MIGYRTLSTDSTMARICVFHDRNDLQVARTTSDAVRSIGHDSWMANSDSGEDWRKEVSQALHQPDCLAAIVIWSKAASGNEIVIDEAEEAKRARRPLLFILCADVELPLGFRNRPRLLLNDSGAYGEKTISDIGEKLARVLESAGQQSRRLIEIELGGKKLKTPAFIFSVSSFETQISLARTLELLKLLR